MKKILLSTAIVAGMSAVAYAQDLSLTVGGTQSTMVGTTFSGVGSSSRGIASIEGVGAGSVTVQNDLSVIQLTPSAYKGSELIVGEAAVAGDIAVTNDRAVVVTGSMFGEGQVTGMGSTSTTFDASLMSNAKSTTALSVPLDSTENSLDGSYEANGMANLSGESATSAGFQLTGASPDFEGHTGTTVAGGFIANAGYDQETNTFDYMQLNDPHQMAFGAPVSIEVTPTDFSLDVYNLGGGSVELVGANSDLFSGATLATTKSDVTLTLSNELLCDFSGTFCDI